MPAYVEQVIALGRNIRSRREALGSTLEELAERSDLETQQLQKIEVGAIRNPTLVTLFRVAEGLGISLEILLRRSE